MRKNDSIRFKLCAGFADKRLFSQTDVAEHFHAANPFKEEVGLNHLMYKASRFNTQDHSLYPIHYQHLLYQHSIVVGFLEPWPPSPPNINPPCPL